MSLFNASAQHSGNELGEDTWDLYQVIEESFGVDLGDYQALIGKSITELADEITARSASSVGDHCLTSVVLYKLRRALQRASESPRHMIRPANRVADLLPWMDRRRTWTMIQEESGLTLPELAFPGWLMALALLSPSAAMLALRLFLLPSMNWAFTIFGAILLILPAIMALSPFARSLPPDCKTVGDLTKVMLARNYAAISKTYGRSSAKDLLFSVRQLVAMQIMTRVEEISPEMKIPSGLNIY